MAWTESGCSNPLTAGTKNDAGILCRSSSAKMRGDPPASHTRPARTARTFGAVAQRTGLVVEIERQPDRYTRTVGPKLRRQVTAGPYAADPRNLVGQLPGQRRRFLRGRDGTDRRTNGITRLMEDLRGSEHR